MNAKKLPKGLSPLSYREQMDQDLYWSPAAHGLKHAPRCELGDIGNTHGGVTASVGDDRICTCGRNAFATAALNPGACS